MIASTQSQSIRLANKPSYNRFRTTSGCPLIFHLAYADDVLIFSSADRRTVSDTTGTLHRYERVSGQKINKSKSKVFIHDAACPRLCDDIDEISSISVSSPSFIYLGCTITY
ncbi:uncharacterized protein M6B38_323555 [Iris pallida]|uniref:Reverse transcriptase domain-containing protein n=1 Tax=Iris pallida TaxID=29817 RepID=A0AAX6HB43_IRIPA|nr:uncharacterized protein M6B38_323555 [Iris pallida]